MTATRAERYLFGLERLALQAVGPGHVAAIVPGDRGWFSVQWNPDTGWQCSCAAVSASCGHIAAVRSVVVAPDKE